MENSPYYLFLDDQRFPKDVFWVDLPLVEWTIVRNYNEFVKIIAKRGLPKFISFDHDLDDTHYQEYHRTGGEYFDYSKVKELTGYDCAKWLVNYCNERNLPLPEFAVHTMNGPGKKNIESYLNSYTKAFEGSS